MSRLSKKERLKVLEMATEIASEAAKNPNVVWMIEFQQELIATVYHTMVTLIEEDHSEFGQQDDDEEDQD